MFIWFFMYTLCDVLFIHFKWLIRPQTLTCNLGSFKLYLWLHQQNLLKKKNTNNKPQHKTICFMIQYQLNSSSNDVSHDVFLHYLFAYKFIFKAISCTANSFIITFWVGKGLLSFITVRVTLTDSVFLYNISSSCCNAAVFVSRPWHTWANQLSHSSPPSN